MRRKLVRAEAEKEDCYMRLEETGQVKIDCNQIHNTMDKQKFDVCSIP